MKEKVAGLLKMKKMLEGLQSLASLRESRVERRRGRLAPVLRYQQGVPWRGDRRAAACVAGWRRRRRRLQLVGRKKGR